MLGSKVILPFSSSLVLAGQTFWLSGVWEQRTEMLFLKLRRFVEAEVGVGFTVILAAAL